MIEMTYLLFVEEKKCNWKEISQDVHRQRRKISAGLKNCMPVYSSDNNTFFHLHIGSLIRIKGKKFLQLSRKYSLMPKDTSIKNKG